MSPSKLFPKDRFGFHSPVWNKQREMIQSRQKMRSRLQHRYGDPQFADPIFDRENADFRREVMEKETSNLYKLDICMEAAWDGLEVAIQELAEFCEHAQMCASICFNNLLESALPVLLERSYYLGASKWITTYFDPGAGDRLIEEVKIENDYMNRTVKRHRKFIMELFV